MADLDTVSKRASAIGIDLGFMRVYPIPDGSIAAQGDRQQIAFKYSGIAATTSTSTPGTLSPYRPTYRPRRR